MRTIFEVVVLNLLVVVVSSATPQVVQWNTNKSYGPDGPWQAVTVGVGTDASGNVLSNVDLYPGGFGESMIFTQSYCSSNTAACQAASAGLYDIKNSSTVLQNIRSNPATVWEWASSAAISQTGIADEVLDAMSVKTQQGLVTANNSTISAIREEYFKKPNGSSYSPGVGILSLGYTGNGSISFNNVTGQTFPGYLATHNITPSNSFGLHYGSASLGIGGSLVWGGYDQSRVLGEVGVFQLSQPGNAIIPSLLNVQIGVENGTSPFDGNGSITNLLHLNSSFNGYQPVVVNPILPYFFFSPETCSNIAQHLPVTLQRIIGLYTWNTVDPQYQRIIQSPTYLALVFQSAPGNLTIKVPFQLLNLTLEPPIVSSSQQYFPCQPFQASDNTGNYYLGRAFLQAAFLGMNWESGTYFLAQGPGPAATVPNIKSIQAKDTTLSSDPISTFLTTWGKNWTPLASIPQSNNTNTSGVLPSNNTSTAVPPKSGDLSSGAKAGIGVGVVIGVAAAAIIAWLIYRRRKRPLEVHPPPSESNKDLGVNYLHEKDAGMLSNEIGGEGLPHEVPTGREVHEM